MQFPSHGANYEALYKNFGIKQPDTVFDLSENVNYLGPSKAVMEAWPKILQTIATYPHPDGEPLRSQIAQTHRVNPMNVLLGNGAAECLTFFAHRFTGKKVILIHPTFSEYQATLKAAGAKICELVVSNIENYRLPIREIKNAMRGAACLYICNPNNPTGSLIRREVLEEFISYGKEQDCELLVDEAFMDWTDEANSIIDLILKYDNVTVLRSMTKMYSIAGIRLGYLVSHPTIVQELKSKLPHWNINAPAISIGGICLEDEAFRTHSIQTVDQIKREILAFLQAYECTVTDSQANFLCFQLKQSHKTRDFYFYCLERGLVLRHTENYRGMDGEWLRLGIKGPEAMNYFKKVMDEWHG
nr:aminotransferase class I/II-fold pyridoxal phosphate-dependent enzyme [Lysinibacillus timonensis]